MTRSLTLLALPTLLLVALPAQARDTRKGGSKIVLDIDTEAARHHFALAGANYERGDYPGALREFERAKLIQPLPAFDYNMALCYERLEQYQEAIDAYQRFVVAVAATEDVTAVDERIEILRRRTTQLRLVNEPAPEPRPAASPLVTSSATPARGENHARSAPWTRRYLGPLSLGAATLAAGGIGLGLYGSADASYNRLHDQCAPRCSAAQIAGLEVREQAGVALSIVGAAALIADSVWWLVASDRRHSQTMAAR